MVHGPVTASSLLVFVSLVSGVPPRVRAPEAPILAVDHQPKPSNPAFAESSRDSSLSSSVHETHRRWGQEREPTLREKRGNRKLRVSLSVRSTAYAHHYARNSAATKYEVKGQGEHPNLLCFAAYRLMHITAVV